MRGLLGKSSMLDSSVFVAASFRLFSLFGGRKAPSLFLDVGE